MEDYLSFYDQRYAPGDIVRHIWTGELYEIIRDAPMATVMNMYEAYNSRREKCFIDTKIICRQGDRIARILDRWKEDLRKSGKRSIVVGREPTGRLLAWYVDTHEEYLALRRDKVKLLYYWALPGEENV